MQHTPDIAVDSAIPYRNVIADHPLFTSWPPEILNRFIKLWRVVTFATGEYIVEEGKQGDSVYVIVSGNVEVYRTSLSNANNIETVAVLSPGEIIGLSTTRLFSEKNERTATVVALSPVHAIKLNLKTLQTFLIQHPNLNTLFKKTIDRVYKWQLAKQTIPFTKLDPEKIINLADRIDAVHVKSGEVIFNEGDPVEDCYLIASGQIEIIKSDTKGTYKLATLGTGMIFGEMAIIFNIPRTATAKAIKDSKLYRLRRLDLLELYASDILFASHLSALMLERSRPEQSANVHERLEAYSDKSLKVVLKNVSNKELYILNERSYYAWKFMDGRHSIADIAAAMKKKFNEEVTTYELVMLVYDLFNLGFISVLGYRFPAKNRKSFWDRIIQVFK